MVVSIPTFIEILFKSCWYIWLLGFLGILVVLYDIIGDWRSTHVPYTTFKESEARTISPDYSRATGSRSVISDVTLGETEISQGASS